jgi:hypothetical protein
MNNRQAAEINLEAAAEALRSALKIAAAAAVLVADSRARLHAARTACQDAAELAGAEFDDFPDACDTCGEMCHDCAGHSLRELFSHD